MNATTKDRTKRHKKRGKRPQRAKKLVVPKPLANEALAKARESVTQLLRYCRRTTGHSRSPNNPDSAQAFGIVQGLALLKICPDAGCMNGLFDELENYVDEEIKPRQREDLVGLRVRCKADENTRLPEGVTDGVIINVPPDFAPLEVEFALPDETKIKTSLHITALEVECAQDRWVRLDMYVIQT